MARVVQRLKRHAGTHRAVPDHRNRIAQTVFRCAAQIPRHGKAQRGGNRRRTMRGTKGVIGALAALGKAGQAPLLAQGADAVTTTGQDFMRIALVRHVPDQAITRRVKHRVQRNGQFDNTQTRAQMATGFGHGGNGFLTDLFGQTGQIGIAQPFQVGGDVHLVQKRCHRFIAHCAISGLISCDAK